jgi:hypothetical protein
VLADVTGEAVVFSVVVVCCEVVDCASLIVCDVTVECIVIENCMLDIEGSVDEGDVGVTIEPVKEGVGVVFETASGVLYGER